MDNQGKAPITDLEQLKDRRALSTLFNWNPQSVEEAKFDRDELTITVPRQNIREACTILKNDFNFFSDLTCADWHPNEPRFHLVYHLLSHRLKDRVRLKVKLDGDDAVLESITSVWPAANFFERELFDLFGIRFLGHPNLVRIMMPQDWDGHPLRKDYPVEGYR